MGTNGVNEKDWKLFRKKISDWQENYMDKLNHEYIEILSGEGNPSDRFWKLVKRINEDKRDTGVSAEMSRSCMDRNIMSLLREGAITVDDLSDFSEELQDRMKAYVEGWLKA